MYLGREAFRLKSWRRAKMIKYLPKPIPVTPEQEKLLNRIARANKRGQENEDR